MKSFWRAVLPALFFLACGHVPSTASPPRTKSPLETFCAKVDNQQAWSPEDFDQAVKDTTPAWAEQFRRAAYIGQDRFNEMYALETKKRHDEYQAVFSKVLDRMLVENKTAAFPATPVALLTGARKEALHILNFRSEPAPSIEISLIGEDVSALITIRHFRDAQPFCFTVPTTQSFCKRFSTVLRWWAI